MGFSITDMLNKDTSMAAAPVKDHTIERISYSKLVPSEDNRALVRSSHGSA